MASDKLIDNKVMPSCKMPTPPRGIHIFKRWQLTYSTLGMWECGGISDSVAGWWRRSFYSRQHSNDTLQTSGTSSKRPRCSPGCIPPLCCLTQQSQAFTASIYHKNSSMFGWKVTALPLQEPPSVGWLSRVVFTHPSGSIHQ